MASKNYFEEIAPQWDAVRSGFFSESVREKAAAAANLRPGSVAADLGAGTGFITEELLKHGVRVIAVDQAENMLEQMKKKFGSKASVEYRLGDAEHLPIESESVNYAFANMYLHHIEHPAVAIQEMVRILKSGGKLIITDLNAHNFEFLAKEQHDLWLGFKQQEIKRWFEEAGLNDVIVESAHATCCAASECNAERAEISIFLASGVKK